MRKIKLPQNAIAVEPLEEQSEILTALIREDVRLGRVVACGPSRLSVTGRRRPNLFCVGDLIRFQVVASYRRGQPILQDDVLGVAEGQACRRT